MSRLFEKLNYEPYCLCEVVVMLPVAALNGRRYLAYGFQLLPGCPSDLRCKFHAEMVRV